MKGSFDSITLADDLCEVHRIYTVQDLGALHHVPLHVFARDGNALSETHQRAAARSLRYAQRIEVPHASPRILRVG